MKLNKICKYFLFTHVFDPQNVSIYSFIKRFSRASPQIKTTTNLSFIYAKQITHGKPSKTRYHQAHVFINIFTTLL